MNIALIEHVREKQKQLTAATDLLKKDFVGLDQVIDQVAESIKIWWIFPELQIRPTIICLWGMTGVGKTDLVRKLISYLKMQDRFLEIEMAGINEPGWTIQGKLESSSLTSEDHCVLFLDEFQKFRTVNDNGTTNENNTAYNDVWTLLSDGKFQSDLSRRTALLEQLLYSKYYDDCQRVQEENAAAENKDKITKTPEKKTAKRIYNTPVYLATRLKRLFKLTEPLEQIMMWDETKIFELYESSAKNPQIYESESYRKMLVVLSGNLDEAYRIASDVEEADIDADFYHELSKKITILDIKAALLRRFRPEQIARFGNNHILYPSLSKLNYYEIIKRKCHQINQLVFDSKGITINYDDSVYKVMYSNGVFPTQGVRPLLSTITNILSTALPTFIFNCLIEELPSINIRFEDGKLFCEIKDKTLSIEIPTVLDSIRNEIIEDARCVIGAHEMGHAIVYAELFGAAPQQICINAVGPYKNGFIIQHPMQSNYTSHRNTIIVNMAGRVAEELVFGPSMVSLGSEADTKAATANAWSFIARLGFDGFVGWMTQRVTDCDFEILSSDKIGDLCENMLKEAKQKAKDIIVANMAMYKEMLKFLMDNNKMTRSDFIRISNRYNKTWKDIPEGGILPNDYVKITKRFLES